MTWVKLDDQILTHPKIVRAGRDARDLFIAGLCYCASHLTDGLIPHGALRMLGGMADIDDPQASAQRLTEVGLWEQADDSYIVHDYLDYQPTREKAEAIKEARQKAGSKGGQISVEAKRQAKRQANAWAKPEQSLTPYPSLYPVQEELSSSGGGGGGNPSAHAREETAHAADDATDAVSSRDPKTNALATSALARQVAIKTRLPSAAKVLDALAVVLGNHLALGHTPASLLEQIDALMDETRPGFRPGPVSVTQINNWLHKATPPSQQQHPRQGAQSGGNGHTGRNGHNGHNGYRAPEAAYYTRTPEQAMPRTGSGKARAAAAGATSGASP